ncbi:MAG TPA: MFS transporter, partial [Sphingomonas sp.]
LRYLRLLPADPPLAARATTEAPSLALTAEDWRHLRLLVAMIAAIVLFRVAYEQSGNVIALWVAHQTDRHLYLFGGVELPATWFQSINPLLIILLTPLLIRWWRRRDGGSSPAVLFRRMSIGCLIAALAMLVMVGAGAQNAATGKPVGPGWVVGYFVLLTIGELYAIPVGLSLIGKLSPKRIAAMLMGSWYIAKFLGSLLAGVMGAYWGILPATSFFGLGAASVFAAAIVLLSMSRAEARRDHAGASAVGAR